MKAQLVPDTLTTCSALEVCRAIRSAWETLEGVTPSQDTVAVLTAQSALETGRWRSMHCWNFGNVKAGPTYEGFYCQFRCNEKLLIDGKLQWRWFDPPHPQCNFRAFESLHFGVLRWLQALREHFPHAYAAAKVGMPLAFTHALKIDHYFTADEAPYARSVSSLWAEYKRLLREPERDTDPAPAEDEHELHSLALAAKASFDPLAAARHERMEDFNGTD